VAYANRLNEGELRRHRRYTVKGGILDVSWLDDTGTMRTVRGRVLDVSENGIAIELPKPMTPGLVVLESDEFKMRGRGAVRHCRRKGDMYIVGFRFTGDLHWRAPGSEIREPIPICCPVSWPTKLLSWLLTESR
jgi:PilZ domain-containing protein